MPKAFRLYNIKDPNVKYSTYISNAKKRDLIFTLNLDQFVELVSKACNYCGDAEKDGYGIGLDRIDSDLGYFINNVVPSCWPCNKWKGEDDFVDVIRHCIKILTHEGVIFDSGSMEKLLNKYPTLNDPIKPSENIKTKTKSKVSRKSKISKKESSIDTNYCNNDMIIDSILTMGNQEFKYEIKQDTWPEFKNATAKEETLRKFEKKRISIIEKNRMNKNSKINKNDAKYFQLLAMEKVLHKELSKDLSKQFAFKYYGHVYRKHRELKAKLEKMQLEHYVPTLRKDLIPIFNDQVITQFNNDITSNESKYQINILFDTAWRVMENYLTDADNFKRYLTVNDRLYWSDKRRRFILVMSHMPYIYPNINLLELPPTISNKLDHINNVVNNIVEKLSQSQSKIIKHTKNFVANPQISKNSIAEEAKDDYIEKSKTRTEYVEDFIQLYYVADKNNFITTADLVTNYQKWMNTNYPKEDQVCANESALSREISKRINKDKKLNSEQKIATGKKSRGYYFRLKTDADPKMEIPDLSSSLSPILSLSPSATTVASNSFSKKQTKLLKLQNSPLTPKVIREEIFEEFVSDDAFDLLRQFTKEIFMDKEYEFELTKGQTIHGDYMKWLDDYIKNPNSKKIKTAKLEYDILKYQMSSIA